MNFLICGGDLRQAKLADNLANDGYSVKATGFDDAENFSSKVKVCKH